MDKQSILIVGAGAAGLIAAKELSSVFNVTVLEARSRIGGRIHSNSINDSLIEGGAEFIHGQLPVTLNLLKESQINYVATEGKMYRKKNGGFVIQKEIINGWENLMHKMKAVKKDMTLLNFLQKNYGDNTNQYFRSQVIAYAEGFDLADINEVSVRALHNEWCREDDTNYRIPTGYSALIEYLKQQAIDKGCTILTDKIVKNIDWRQNFITALTSEKEVFEANKLLVTVPLNMLSNTGSLSSIQFSPVINNYVKAAGDIGIGSVIKIVIKFKKTFWQNDAGFFLSDCPYFPTWWTQLPDTTPILTGWFGGPKVTKISKLSDDELEELAFQSLAAIFNISIESLQQNKEFAAVFNWEKMPLSAGGYSYDKLNSPSAREVLSTPLFKTIFFAGEALYNGDHPGTVEAALVSGQHAVAQILGSKNY